MLVLSRKPSEKVLLYTVGEDGRRVLVGRIMLVEVRGDRARLGFDFHSSVQIVREELELEETAE